MTRPCDDCAVRRHVLRTPPRSDGTAMHQDAAAPASQPRSGPHAGQSGEAEPPQDAPDPVDVRPAQQRPDDDGNTSKRHEEGSERGIPPTRPGGSRASAAFPGLADTTVAKLLTPVLPGDEASSSSSLGDCSVTANIFARVALATAIEPGDQEAGRILQALGPVAFVSAIIDGTDARTLLQRLCWRGEEFARSGDLTSQSGAALVRRDDVTSRPGAAEASTATDDHGASPLPVGPVAWKAEHAVAAVVTPFAASPPGRRSPSQAPSAVADWGPSLGAVSDATDATRPSLPSRGTSMRENTRAERRLDDCLARWRSRLSLAEAERILDRAARLGSRLLTPHSPFWPAGFDSLDEGAPLALWVRGDPSRLARLDRSIALIGARAATAYGEHVAGESAAGLVDRGFAIVSGGAYGIDAAAHRAALASGGVTLAFLAGGVDRLYPAGNSELLRRIAATGVLAAELPPGSAPTRWRFLMRNRLIAASATATVVVEAGHRSGSLNTAGHAAQMARPLGAVPGSILSPASAGTHRLIREYAATCVTTVEEMAELADPLGSDTPPPDGSAPQGAARAGSDPEPTVVAHLSSSRAASADEVAARAGLPFTTVAAVLGRMDVEGRARERAGGWVLIGDTPRRASR